MNPNNPTIIQINSTTIVKTVLVLIFFSFLYFIRDLALVVLTAIVIASAVEPIIKFLSRHGIARLAGALGTYVILGLVLSGIVYFFLPPLLSDLSNFLSSVPEIADSVSLWNPLSGDGASRETAQSLSQDLASSKDLVNLISFDNLLAEPSLEKGSGTPIDFINQFRLALSNVSEGFVSVVSTFFGGLLGFILIVVLSFYLAVQEDGIGAFLKIVTPVRHEAYVISLWKRAQEKIGFWMQGQLLLGVLVGVLVYLGLMVLGVKNALFFAFLAAVFEIIPVFGPILSAIPPIAASFADGGVTAALLVAGLFIIIQQFENHLIYPLVVKKIIGVPPIMVILAIIIGGKLAGFLGILLSVPIATVILEYFRDVERKKLGASPSVT
ncbi:MAG: hypothetical protein UY17_C0036G0003 [Candidatus Beckwithbacteria bacterium GW2011_GWC2_47_9]|uniref:Permease n=2 Tax=Patescibacteria group TaxID=1783273 RepID=A0A0G1M878_9BACT|nr:MAG: hypothetical protein UW71_C0018G0002 [Parcubacteria group bacterium GW2011_GWB1_44_7]KKU04509.1 MAG: hypothetical protein UX06_C0016G0002 [Candidatus Giovannonibacteria bacterium GW2011_GWA2_45_21]KKU86924.1 MAG: hypothetical protein UY17_C0036G0003 [Candidatus Beckwithbacteria bacterium GW2011_GWC2_47_9]